MRISDWSSDVCSSDLIHHRGAAFDAEIQFGGRKGFRAIFETPVGAGKARGIVAKLLGSVDGNLFDFGHFHTENDTAPRGTDRVIEMDDRGFRAFEAVETGDRKSVV